MDRDLQQLFDDYLEGDASPKQIEQLETRLRQPQVLAEFVEQSHLHRQLHDALLAEANQDLAEEEAWASIAVRKIRWTMRPAVRYFTRPTPLSLTAAAAVIGLLLMAMTLMVPPFYRAMTRSDGRAPLVAEAIVAEVIVARGVRWAPAAFVEGRPPTRLASGQAVELLQGTIALRFASGALVVLEGPARFTPQDRNRMQLDVGKLAARVPPPAVGFLVCTPQVDVFDLGTEFGIAVSADSAAEIIVVEGKVECFQRSAAGATSRVRLTAGQGATVAADGAQLVKRDAVDQQEVAAVRRRGAPVARNFAERDFVSFHDLGGNPSPGHITTQANLQATTRLIDYSTGAEAGVQFNVVGATSIDNRAAEETRPPRPGTPAGDLFAPSGINLDNGFVCVKGGTLKFALTGLNPRQRYDIAIYGDRNERPDGRERFTLVGAQQASNRSSTGIIDTLKTELETRPNADSGHVVRWTDIAPGADGRLEIRITTTGLNIAYVSALRVSGQASSPAEIGNEPSGR